MGIDTSTNMRESRFFANVLWTIVYLVVLSLIEYFTGYGVYALAVFAVYAIHSLQNLQVINSVELNQVLSGLDQRISRIEEKLELEEFDYVLPSDRLSRHEDRFEEIEMRLSDIEEKLN